MVPRKPERPRRNSARKGGTLQGPVRGGIREETAMDFTNLKSKLEKKGYQVREFQTKEEATAYLKLQIKGETVGIGGSETVNQMKLYEALTPGNEVWWHNRKPENVSADATKRAANAAHIYISSVNAIAETGEIVNIDYTGNRVAATNYGPRKVYFVVGENKVAPTLERAVWRARNVAAPQNARRLNRKTPCAGKADHCYDCQSPDRICRSMSVFLMKPAGCEYEIILIHEALGF